MQTQHHRISMKKLYDSKEKRTVVRLFLWFLLIAGNVHFYYTQEVVWALESVSRVETMTFVAFMDVSLFLFLLIWQSWDGFDSEISIRYLFSFGLAIFGYRVFYPAFFNAFHAVKEMPEIYTLSGDATVLTILGTPMIIACFWTFAGISPLEALDIYKGRERKKKGSGILGAFFSGLRKGFNDSFKKSFDASFKKSMGLAKVEPKEANEALAKAGGVNVLDINQERERVTSFKSQ